VNSLVHPQLVGRTKAPDREVYVAWVRDAGDWPAEIDDPQPHFVVVLAMDASAVESDRISSFANRLIAQGMVYLCAWGPDCKRVHDIVDDLRSERPETDDAFVATDWFEDEDLDEALWCAVFSAYPSEDYMESCGAVLAIVVDNPEWRRHVEARLIDMDHFNDEMLAQEAGP
jgi:hypothetical protein